MSALPNALTPEEWASFPNWPHARRPESDAELPIYYPSKHGIAAANLHGQPFGFTQDEARVVAKYAAHVGCNCGDNQCHEEGDEALLLSAAAKIAALLSPAARSGS